MRDSVRPSREGRVPPKLVHPCQHSASDVRGKLLIPLAEEPEDYVERLLVDGVV